MMSLTYTIRVVIFCVSKCLMKSTSYLAHVVVSKRQDIGRVRILGSSPRRDGNGKGVGYFGFPSRLAFNGTSLV